jgi:hypothetical protein
MSTSPTQTTERLELVGGSILKACPDLHEVRGVSAREEIEIE